MSFDDGSYFRQRADVHLAKAGECGFGTASVHRRFADLYLEQAAIADQSGRARPAQATGWTRLGTQPAAALPIASGAAAPLIPAAARREA